MKAGALWLIAGLVVMTAEVWMAITWPHLIPLAVLLFAMSAFTEFSLFGEWWRYDVRHARKVRAWKQREARMLQEKGKP